MIEELLVRDIQRIVVIREPDAEAIRLIDARQPELAVYVPLVHLGVFEVDEVRCQLRPVVPLQILRHQLLVLGDLKVQR